MQTSFLILSSLLNAIFASMALAVLLPMPAVERMFIAGLSVLTIAPFILLLMLFMPFKRAVLLQLGAGFIFGGLLAWKLL